MIKEKQSKRGILKEIKAELPKTAKLILLFLLCVLSFNQLHSKSYYQVNFNNKIDSLEIYSINGIEYIDLTILTSVSKAKIFYKKTQEEIKIETKKKFILLVMNSSYYRSAGNVHKMPHTPIYHNEIILFPIISIENVFSKIFPDKTIFGDYKMKILEKSTLLDIKQNDNTISLVFNFTPEYSLEKTMRDMIFFLQNCFVNEKKFRSKSNTGLLRVVEIIDDNKESTLILTLAPDYELDYIKDTADTIKIFTKKRENQQKNKNIGTINTIIIDAGHGGKDPGAIGPTGLQEKVITLDIAIKLKKLMNSSFPDMKVVMTRTDDTYVSLKDRTMLANKYPNSIFISIHCNASLNKQTRGAETYFLSTAKTDWQRAVEARENASLVFDMPEEEKKGLDFILWDLAQNEYLSESSRLAELVQKEFEKNSSFPRGLNQAGFFVLKGNYMPAVLVEVAFISNKDDEKLLNTNDFRQKCANNIFKGVSDFLNEHKKKAK